MSSAPVPGLDRYTGVAIFLHWAIALMILAQLASGLWMVDAIQAPEWQATAFTVYQVHKSIGLTILMASVLRVLWRLFNAPPPMPHTMSRLERRVAGFAHLALYLLMLAIPLAGWAMVSASPWNIPTLYFNWFVWPHVEPLATLEGEAKAAAEATLKLVHRTMAYAMVVLLVGHVGAALRHHFILRDGVLTRMLPRRR